MTGWQVLGVAVLVTIAYVVGRQRHQTHHETPFLHDPPRGEMYVRRVQRPTHEYVWDLSGTPWDKAEMPGWYHKCYAHTCTIYSNGLSHRDRCACGGERWGVFGRWTRRDERCQQTSGSGSSSASPPA